MALQQKRQLTFDWSGGTPVAPMPTPEIPQHASLPPATPEPLVPRGTDGVYEWLDELIPPDCHAISLPWDFESTFPAPLDEAIRDGALNADSLNDESIATLHHEHARECLAVLSDLEALRRAFGTGTDPQTGKAPHTSQAREGLAKLFAEQPHTLKHAFEVLLDTYENVFGDGAAEAFRLYLAARNRGVTVTAERATQQPSPPPPPPSSNHRHRDQSDDGTASHDPNVDSQALLKSTEPELPVPKPLPCAVRRGVFGVDEDGDPVEPSEEEVRAITEYHADRLSRLLDAIIAAENQVRYAHRSDRAAAVRALDCAYSAFQSAAALYEEDFGDQAARHLESYVRHVAGREEEPTTAYTPGHPWYYLKRGDGRPPLPVEQIPPADLPNESLPKKLPRAKEKRRAAFRQMLDEQRRQLKEDKLRYQELLDRGAAALSDYDRQIAHGGDDELAWASAVALKFNHISSGLGLLARLDRAVRGRTETDA